MIRGAVLIAIAGIATSHPAPAQPVDDAARAKLGTCRRQTDDVQRLACFDQAFAAAGTAAPAPAPAPAPPAAPAPQQSGVNGKLDLSMPDGQRGWVVRQAKAPLDGSPIVAAVLPATQARIHRFATGTQKAALIVICRDRKTDVFVGYSDIVDGIGPIPVSYRIGDKQPVDDTWGISQDFQSYGIWHTAKTVPFVLSLVDAGNFFVRANPGPMGTSEASFDLAGMDQAIAPVRQACGW